MVKYYQTHSFVSTLSRLCTGDDRTKIPGMCVRDERAMWNEVCDRALPTWSELRLFLNVEPFAQVHDPVREIIREKCALTSCPGMILAVVTKTGKDVMTFAPFTASSSVTYCSSTRPRTRNKLCVFYTCPGNGYVFRPNFPSEGTAFLCQTRWKIS